MRLKNKLFGDINIQSVLASALDNNHDILVFGATGADTFKQLGVVLRMLKMTNLKIKPNKLHQKLRFLDIVSEQKGVEPYPITITAITHCVGSTNERHGTKVMS